MKKRSFLSIALSLMAALSLSLVAVGCDNTNDDPVQNTISFEIDVDDYTGEGVADKTVATGSDFTLPTAPDIEYYEFEYWQLGTEHYNAGDTYKVETDGDVKFSAVYAETFVLNYSVADGLDAPEAVSGKVGAEVTLSAGEDNGYSEFKSWVIGGTEYDAGAKFTPAHGANTATAAYTDTFVLTYAVDNGTAPDVETGVVGDKVTLPSVPDYGDYAFECWLINGTLYNAGDEYEPALGATTATAQYKVAYVYVTFAIEENTGLTGTLPSSPVRVSVGDSLELTDIPAIDAPEYYTAAWYIGNDEVDLSEEVFTENTTVTAKRVYVGWDEVTAADALVFNEVENVGYTVMAGENFGDHIADGTAYIPATHNNLPVVGITAGSSTENAFGNTAAAGLECIYIPASVTEIGDYAFSGNTTLTTVIYERGIQLETIGKSAFRTCSALVTFSDDANNAGLHIPASVKLIDEYAFYGMAASKRVVNVFFDEQNGQLEKIATYAFAATSQTAAAAGGITLNTAFPSTLKEIELRAFYCNVLGRIDFGENATITTIGEHAFSNTGTVDVSTVTEIIIPKSVTTLGIHVFQNSKHLEYVEFEEGSGIDTIPEYTFSGCAALEEVVFPAGLTAIDSNAFASCFTAANGGHGINLNGADGKFVLPAGVTKIDESVFAASVFNEAVIPNTVTEIATSAFGTSGSNYTTIKTLTFAEGGTAGLVIGEKAFNSQKLQLALTIPARVTSIGAYAFWKANITELNFENGETPLAIGDNAFNSMGKAPTASLSSSTTLYPFTATSVTLPARTASVGTGAFCGQLYLTEVKFATGCNITAISDYAFAYCSKLESVDIPESVTSIGQYAYTVYSLKNIKSTVYNNGTAANTTHSDSDIYTDIDKITIPAKVESIGTYAFYNRGLKISTLEFKGAAQNNDLTIDANAFGIVNTFATAIDSANGGNVTLTSVTFPANLVSVGGLFLNGAITSITCQYKVLASIDLSACTRLTTLGDNFMAGTALTSISIPDSVTTIGNYVFANKMVANGDITATMQFSGEVTLPKNLNSLGAYFCAGVDVTAFKIDDTNAKYKTVDGVIFSKDGATLVNYPFGKTDTSYTVPVGCTTIGDGAFKSNKKITSFDFNDVTTVEGQYAFAKTAITSLDHSFESIGNNAFLGSALQSATIDITGSTVPTSLFQDCASLTSATLGTHITALGNLSFSGCTLLNSVTIQGTLTTVGNSVFTKCSSLQSVDLSNVTSLGSNVFQNATGLTSVTLGAITNIAVNTFANTSLTELTLISTTLVTLANTNAFTGYSATKQLTIKVPASLISEYESASLSDGNDNKWSTLVENGTITFAAIAEQDTAD